jgi:hypothetical protein
MQVDTTRKDAMNYDERAFFPLMEKSYELMNIEVKYLPKSLENLYL